MGFFFSFRETGLRPTKSKLERLLEEERLKLEEQLDRSMASITAKLEMHMAEESRCDW